MTHATESEIVRAADGSLEPAAQARLDAHLASCAACRDEHLVLEGFARTGLAPLYGLNYKDKRDDAIAWLKRFGDPYQVSIVDADGRVGIDYGVYGVPETYVIDKQGVIRYKRIGPVTPAILDEKIVPLIKELNRG